MKKLSCIVPFKKLGGPNLPGGDAEQHPADPGVGLLRDPHPHPHQLQHRRPPDLGRQRGPEAEGALELASRRRGLRNVGEGPGAGGPGGGHEQRVAGDATGHAAHRDGGHGILGRQRRRGGGGSGVTGAGGVAEAARRCRCRHSLFSASAMLLTPPSRLFVGSRSVMEQF